MSGFRIRWQLDPVEQCVPWGDPPTLSLHWFGLTSGLFTFETEAGLLPAYEAGPPGCDYYLARLHEDLEELLPWIGQPVPADIAAPFLEDGPPVVPSDEAGLETWDTAADWWLRRGLDMGYLRRAPSLTFCRVGEVMHFRGSAHAGPEADRGPPLLLTELRASAPAAAVLAEIADFQRGFLKAMGERVAAIVAEGWTRADCALDVPALAAEHESRVALHARPHAVPPAPDWGAVRAALRHLR